jgi:hypothetical protein
LPFYQNVIKDGVELYGNWKGFIKT